MQQLIKYVEKLEHPYIIGGDFNVDYQLLPLYISKQTTIYSPSSPTIYIEYDRYGNELNTSCVSIKNYLPFTYDYFMTKNIILTHPTVLSFEYSDHAPVHSKIIDIKK